ncbi:MAG: ATPase domain-containing protein [Nitrososphaerales archaeon]
MISTSSVALDNLLGGGVRAGMLTDVFGASGTGKTQLCFQLCVNCAKPKNKDGLDGNVLFMDATNIFRPERIAQMAKHIGLDDKILDKIYVAKVYSSADQITAIKRIPQMKNLQLVVIDSVGDLYSFEYKQSMGAEKHLKLMRFMHELALYAINCNVAIIVTNSVRFTGTEQVQYLDKSISNFTHFKISLSKHNDVFKAQLLQPALGLKEAFFRVSDKGITDV